MQIFLKFCKGYVYCKNNAMRGTTIRTGLCKLFVIHEKESKLYIIYSNPSTRFDGLKIEGKVRISKFLQIVVKEKLQAKTTRYSEKKVLLM